MDLRLRHWLAALTLPLLAAGCGGGAGDGGDAAAADASRTQALAAKTTAAPLAPSARLTTPWTDAALQAEVPLPEYPRPQVARTDWLNLNGTWRYTGGAAAPDAENPPATAPAFPAQPEQIRVPYPVESYLSGIQRMNERNLWYRRTFTVPPGWSGKHVKLNFGAVDRKATVYVNGQQVGQHSGGYDAFSFDITPYLKSGDNELVVGAFDPTTGDDMLGKQTLNPGGIFYTPTSGIWQTVWLEPVTKAHITRLDMTPDLPNKQLRITVRGDNLAGLVVDAVASAGGKKVGTGSGVADVEFTVPVPNAHLWSPNDPFLYDLKVRLRKKPGAKVHDEVSSYFGMRSISIGTVDGVPRPLLNGQYVFQYGPLDQGFWPDGLYTAPTDDALKSDLQAIKDLGMNMVRKHIKVEPQRWFYWADKLGLMVWQDMPHAWDAESNAEVQARVKAEDKEIVDEHRSSPAVVTWVIFNESWGDFDMVGMANQFKAWDASRLINTHSGINFAPGDSGAGDLIDLHDYPGPSAPAWQPNRISVLGEFGGNGLRVDGHMWNPDSTCCYNLYPDSATLTNVYTAQVDSLRELSASKGLSAAVYTEISDVEDELNGFLTYDRQVQKMDFARVKAAHQALIDGVPYLRKGSSYSFRSVSPGAEDRYLRHGDGGLGVTDVVDAGSPAALKQDSSWKVVNGLADSSCLSFEAVNQPGQFLRHAADRMRIDANDNSDGFRGDATFCPRKALNGGGGLSLEAKNLPGQYVRHMNAEVWLNAFEDSSSFRADASWAQSTGWWRSSVLINPGDMRSLRVLTPGYDNRYVRHQDGLAFTEVVTADSSDTLKLDATWHIVTGLADASCYSFESRNFPGEYLRHANSRVHRDPLEDSDLYRADATFCAEGTPDGSSGTRFSASNFPNRYLRHYASEVWIADGTGGSDWNTSGSYLNDTRWAVENAWAP
ncbi:MAG TPA: AbfB domain-containing protein [Ideonella sp.]|uniref:AbfB domain-containing protein n=1 Tax=Ideonella sp. TaxID=1929293 RepID=UPI002C7D2E3B|nr:AbfB domain-containing protein [Ideonella sp.]HSI48511.1 AbfB domain-containing protein [Ideonella sp.]